MVEEGGGGKVEVRVEYQAGKDGQAGGHFAGVIANRIELWYCEYSSREIIFRIQGEEITPMMMVPLTNHNYCPLTRNTNDACDDPARSPWFLKPKSRPETRSRAAARDAVSKIECQTIGEEKCRSKPGDAGIIGTKSDAMHFVDHTSVDGLCLTFGCDARRS